MKEVIWSHRGGIGYCILDKISSVNLARYRQVYILHELRLLLYFPTVYYGPRSVSVRTFPTLFMMPDLTRKYARRKCRMDSPVQEEGRRDLSYNVIKLSRK